MIRALLTSSLLAVLALPVLASDIEVQALFTGAAMLKIDGQSKMLKAGQSFSGVTLIEANSRTAVIELNGERRQVGVSERVSSSYRAPEIVEVRIPRDAAMQYQAMAEFNGRRVQVLVDTGANIVAMNSAQASALGIDYLAGQPTRVETAAGVVDAWVVTLKTVSVGGLHVANVKASVIEGEFPRTVLLGMTYLKHVTLQEKDGVLLLSRSY